MSSCNRRSPPAQVPWDAPLSAAALAFVDLEMTGLDAARHRIVEICVVRVVGGVSVDRLESYVRPEPLPEKIGNQHVHGIDRISVAAAPTFAELAPRVRGLLADAVMLAHGSRWDAAFLNAEMKRAEQDWQVVHHIDTVSLSRRLLSADNYKLATLAKLLDIPNENPHRAGSDVAVTRRLFEHLVTAMGASSASLTPRQLWERSVGKNNLVPGILHAAEAAAAHGQRVLVRYRASKRGQQDLEFVVTDVRRDLDPPVVLGYLHHTRGRRELRADRILSLELVAK